jgi:hypothetical protein
MIAIGRERRRSLFLLLGWAGTLLLLCSAARSRVLRYMLPAYPAFAILAAIGLLKWIPRRFFERAMDWIPPLAVAAAASIVLLLPPVFHATDIRAIAEAQSRALPSGTLVGFYDKGDPRYDETNQLEWYGNDVPTEPYTDTGFRNALQAGSIRVFVLDKATCEERIRPFAHDVIAQAGHLISVRLKPR